jgi:hypothetical protein
VITLDDYVPYYNNQIIYDRAANDGALWATILEKAFAKVNGNYEFINYGW